MIDATQPRVAPGARLSAGILAAALFALLAFAPLASAAPDPVGSGSTTITLKKSVVNAWKKQGVKIKTIKPTSLKGTKATFTVTGGSLDPTTGAGTVTHSGGLKFKVGKRSATVKALVIDTTKKSVTAKVAGKKMKMATIVGASFVRNGFGVNLTVKGLKLTKPAANQLNKKLGFTAKKKGKGKASASKGKSAPFKANQNFASAKSETQPITVTVLPAGEVAFATNPATIKKLADVEVKIEKLGPTTEPSSVPSPTYAFPISGGTISPVGTAGTVQTAGGLRLVQELKFPAEVMPPLVTKITLGAFYFDFSAKTVSVEVVAESNASKELNLGSLARSSIADTTLTGATVASDPVARTVSIQNAPAALQVVSAEVLNGFVKVFEGYKKALGTPEAKEQIAVGNPLGTISFTAQTQ
jgi:hypothetical protein